MSKLLGFIGLTIGGWLGWILGQRFSMAAAILLSIVGTGVGLYVARRITDDYF